nr:hypothetical protein [Tanacetum cinerariifolium]
QHGQEQVAVGCDLAATVAAQGDVQVVTQPSGQADVPATPELGVAGGWVLQCEAMVGNHRQGVGDEDLLDETLHEPRAAFGELVQRVGAVVELVDQDAQVDRHTEQQPALGGFGPDPGSAYAQADPVVPQRHTCEQCQEVHSPPRIEHVAGDQQQQVAIALPAQVAAEAEVLERLHLVFLFKHIRAAVVQRAVRFEPGKFHVGLEVRHVLILTVPGLELAARVLHAGQHAITQALERTVVFLTQIDAVGLRETRDHGQRRKCVVVVRQRALLALQLVRQEALRVNLIGGDLEFLHRPVKEVLTVGRHCRRHHGPGRPIRVVVSLVERQIVPVADDVIRKFAEPAFDDLRFLLAGGQRVRFRELQAQISRGHAAQCPFAHRLAGVVEIRGLQRIGLGPGCQHVECTIELFRATITHVLHHHLAGGALHGSDVFGRIAKSLIGDDIQCGACLVRTLVLAAELQWAGIGLRNGVTVELVLTALEFLDTLVVTLRRHKCRRSARAGGKDCRGQHCQREKGGEHQFWSVHRSLITRLARFDARHSGTRCVCILSLRPAEAQCPLPGPELPVRAIAVFVATVHVPEARLKGLHRVVGELDVDLITAVAHILDAVFAVDQQLVDPWFEGGAAAHDCRGENSQIRILGGCFWKSSLPRVISGLPESPNRSPSAASPLGSVSNWSMYWMAALGAIRRPVLVTAEVEIVGLLLVGQRRQVRHGVAHFREATEHGLVVAQRGVVVELVALGREQLVTVNQPAGRLVNDHQLHTLALEGIVQLLHAAIAFRRGVEFGAQVFAGPEQPVALGLNQRGEVLLVAADVVFLVVCFRAQAAARLGSKARGSRVCGVRRVAGGEQCSGQAREAEQFDQVCVHRNIFLSPGVVSGFLPGRSTRLSAGAPADRGFRPDDRPEHRQFTADHDHRDFCIERIELDVPVSVRQVFDVAVDAHQAVADGQVFVQLDVGAVTYPDAVTFVGEHAVAPQQVVGALVQRDAVCVVAIDLVVRHQVVHAVTVKDDAGQVVVVAFVVDDEAVVHLTGDDDPVLLLRAVHRVFSNDQTVRAVVWVDAVNDVVVVGAALHHEVSGFIAIEAVPHVREFGVDDPARRVRAVHLRLGVRGVLGNTDPVRLAVVVTQARHFGVEHVSLGTAPRQQERTEFLRRLVRRRAVGRFAPAGQLGVGHEQHVVVDQERTGVLGQTQLERSLVDFKNAFSADHDRQTRQEHARRRFAQVLLRHLFSEVLQGHVAVVHEDGFGNAVLTRNPFGHLVIAADELLERVLLHHAFDRSLAGLGAHDLFLHGLLGVTGQVGQLGLVHEQRLNRRAGDGVGLGLMQTFDHFTLAVSRHRASQHGAFQQGMWPCPVTQSACLTVHLIALLSRLASEAPDDVDDGAVHVVVHTALLQGLENAGNVCTLWRWIDARAADRGVAINAAELVVDQRGVVLVLHLPGGKQRAGLYVGHLALERFTEAMHARAGTGPVRAVAFQTVLFVVLAGAGVSAAHLPHRIQTETQTQISRPAVDVFVGLFASHVLIANGVEAAADAIAVAGQPGQAAPVVDGVQIAVVVRVAVGLQTQPGQITTGGLVEVIDGLALVFQAAAVVTVVSTVFAEALRSTHFGFEQRGVEGPVDGFDVGVVPLTVIIAQALTAHFQDLARVGREAAVADPEFAQRGVAVIHLAAVGSAARALGALAVRVGNLLIQRVSLNGVGSSDYLAHRVSAPVARLAIRPWAQVQTDTIDVATAAGAEVTVVFHLPGHFDFEAEILSVGQGCQRSARPAHFVLWCLGPAVHAGEDSAPGRASQAAIVRSVVAQDPSLAACPEPVRVDRRPTPGRQLSAGLGGPDNPGDKADPGSNARRSASQRPWSGAPRLSSRPARPACLRNTVCPATVRRAVGPRHGRCPAFAQSFRPACPGSNQPAPGQRCPRAWQIEHGQRDQRTGFAVGESGLQQAFGFTLLGFGGVRLDRQQLAQARLRPGRSGGRSAVSRLGLLDQLRVAGTHLDVREADLCVAVAQVRQLPIVLLRQRGVAAFQGFVGQALIGQAGTAAQTDSDRQAQQFQRWATVAHHFNRTTCQVAVDGFVWLDLNADVGRQVSRAQCRGADDLAAVVAFFARYLEVHAGARLDVGELAVAFQHVQHAGVEGGKWSAFSYFAVRCDQTGHGAFTRHGHVQARYADQTRRGVADEVHAVDRLGDEAEGGQTDDEDAGAEGYCTQTTERALAAAGVFVLARLGEVVALQGREHFAHADEIARQVRSDQVAQRCDVLSFQVLELATHTAGRGIDGAHLQVDVHGQTEVIDQELQAAFDDLTHAWAQIGRSNEAQTAGGKVFDANQWCVRLPVEQSQLGRDLDPCARSDHCQQHGNEDAASRESHGPRRPGVEPTLEAGHVAAQFCVLAGPGLSVETEEDVDLHQGADDLVVIQNDRVGRSDPVSAARQQQGQNQAGDADPQQVGQQELDAVLEARQHGDRQAQQGSPHRHALVEQHDAGEDAETAYTQAQRAGVLPKVVAIPAIHQLAAGLQEALFRRVLNSVDRGIGHVERVIAQAHQAEPARLVIAGQELEAAQTPVLQRIAFNVGDEHRVGYHGGAEHRHAAGHRQHALGQSHRAHVDVTLSETQFVPLAHDVAAADFAELVGGQAADIAEQLEPRNGLLHNAFSQHGVAVDHGHYGAVRVDDVQENHAAHEVRCAHRVAPDADDTNEENEIFGMRVKQRCRQGHSNGSQQTQIKQPTCGLEEAVLQPLHNVGGAFHEAHQVNHALASWRVVGECTEALVAVAQDDHVGFVDDCVEIRVQQRGNVRDLGLDVVLVRTVDAGVFDVAVEDAQVVAFTDQHFSQLDQWAFAQVIGTGLEAQTQQGHFASVAGGNDVECVLNLGHVAAHQGVEQRCVNVQAAGAVGQGANVLRQAGTAEGEAWAHVVLRQVQSLVLADHVHHFTAIDADCLGDVADFVGEGDFGRVPYVAGVLDHFGNGDVLADDRCVEFFVQGLQNVAGRLVEFADNGHRRVIVVGDRGAFTQEFRVYRDAEVNAGFLARAVFKDRDNHVGNGAWQNGAANDDGVTGSLVTQHEADFAADRFNEVQLQIAVLFARGADADHRQVSSANRFGEVGGAAQFAGLDTGLQQLAQTRLNDWRLAVVDQIDLGSGDVHTHNIMTTRREATSADSADIAQTKDADTHSNLLDVYAI